MKEGRYITVLTLNIISLLAPVNKLEKSPYDLDTRKCIIPDHDVEKLLFHY